jgi:hypothetical protein
VAFWESPDVFLVPRGGARPSADMSVSDDFFVTAGSDYDIYVRVNNDGCNTVTNLQAALYLADPTLGFVDWGMPITGGYASGDAGFTTVGPYSRQVLGPFHWKATGSGHMCVLAAIRAMGESGPSTSSPPPQAFQSPQVAQRNIQFTGNGCGYAINNNSSDGVEMALGISMGTPPPQSITLTFRESNASELAQWAEVLLRCTPRGSEMGGSLHGAWQ